MTTVSLARRVSRHIADEIVHEASVAEVDPNVNLTSLGLLTSLSLLRVIAWVGDEFNIPVGELEIDPQEFGSIHSIVHFIETHASAAKPAQ